MDLVKRATEGAMREFYIIKMIIAFLENSKDGESITIKRADDNLIVNKNSIEFVIPE